MAATTAAVGAQHVRLLGRASFQLWNLVGRRQYCKAESEAGVAETLENDESKKVEKPSRDALRRSRAKDEDADYELISDLSGRALLRKLRLEQTKMLEESHNGGSASLELQRYANPLAVGTPSLEMSTHDFPEDVEAILFEAVNPEQVEIRPDGALYLPVRLYKKVLWKSFGPGAWAIMPLHEDFSVIQSDSEGGSQLVTRDYAMFCLGRYFTRVVGEHAFHSRFNTSLGKAQELVKDDAITKCCRDLGIAREIWDPEYVASWKSQYARAVWCENVRTKERKRLWRKKKTLEMFPYPWVEVKA